MSVPSWNISRPLQHVLNVYFFPLWCAPAVPPELGAQRKFWGHVKKTFPALCTGICAPIFKTVSAPTRVLLKMLLWWSSRHWAKKAGHTSTIQHARYWDGHSTWLCISYTVILVWSDAMCKSWVQPTAMPSPRQICGHDHRRWKRGYAGDLTPQLFMWWILICISP